jgi:ubiquinone/menaquinone biosynthesis C-methylase UbiE
MDSNNKYTKMQQNHYDTAAKQWDVNHRDPVVGGFDAHNEWADYDNFLFKGISNTQDKVALDFGCGPGRNIAKFANQFSKIDGTDISQINLDNAAKWATHNSLPFQPTLYKADGVGIPSVPTNTYDVVFSTICIQHICVHEIRLNLFKEFNRVLKDNGSIAIQMGFGKLNKPGVSYYANYYEALTTNGWCDVQIDNVEQLKADIELAGFHGFDYDIRPVGPGDLHSNWIFFRANK